MLAGHTGNYARFEIEKKYLLKSAPANLPRTFNDIEDLYLPDSSLRLRIVKSESGDVISRNLTKKDKSPEGDPSISIMTSLYLTERDLSALGSLTGATIQKRRYIEGTERRRTSIDFFRGPFEGLILAEVEFKTTEDRDQYIPPDRGWVEVTGDPRYSCGYLSSAGRIPNPCC